VNQWQIIAAARHGRTAALAAPFKPKDAELFSIISSFDAAYSAYNGYQAGMERFWTLRTCSSRACRNWRPRCSRKAWRAPTTCRWCCRCWAPATCRAAPGARALGEIDLITLDVAAPW
jgi:exoribonuclease-2